MSWSRRHYLESYLRSSLWIIPVGAVVLHLVVSKAVHELDARLNWAGVGLGLEGAKALCNAVITFSLSFIVFTFGSLLVAIQVASGQYTPRIIATTLLRDNIIRYTVGLFVFTFLFAIKALNRTETVVPQLVVLITGILGLICLVAFMFLILFIRCWMFDVGRWAFSFRLLGVVRTSVTLLGQDMGNTFGSEHG